MLQWSGKIQVFIIYHITICNDCLLLITLYWSTGREYISVCPNKAELAHITLSFGSMIMYTQNVHRSCPHQRTLLHLVSTSPLHQHQAGLSWRSGRGTCLHLNVTPSRRKPKYPDRVNSKGRTKLVTSSGTVAIYRLMPFCICGSSSTVKIN